MAKTTPTFNGVALAPSAIDVRAVPYGTTTRSANGTLYHTRRGVKREWVYQFDSVDVTTATAVVNIQLLTGTFVHVDEEGASYTVLCTDAGPLEWSVEQGAPGRLYSMSLSLYEV